jgi:hypothetical protein
VGRFKSNALVLHHRRFPRNECDSGRLSGSPAAFKFAIDAGLKNQRFDSFSDGCYAGRHYKGGIDDVRVYNRALNAAEIKQLYNTGAANVAHSNIGISSGLIGYWPLDGATTNWTTGVTAIFPAMGTTDSLWG